MSTTLDIPRYRWHAKPSKMATQQTLDQAREERRNSKLLARSRPRPERPLITLPDGQRVLATTQLFTVRNHPFEDKLREGLRASIHRVLNTTPIDWISVDYLRLGYSKTKEENPVTMLVTVEEGQVSRAEAQRLVDALYEECVK
jgi:hypothetical protein